MNLAVHEKRREVRYPADGPVRVRFADPQPAEIEGQLMDVSPSGFRMSHANQSLQAGQMVEFSHSHAMGEARVMWNKIQGQRVETGFLIVAAK